MKTTLEQPRTSTRRSAGAALQIKNILVPTDFSAASLEVIRFARSLGEFFHANLHLLHVLEPEHSIASLLDVPLVVSDPEIRRRVRHHLRDLAQENSLPVAPENIHIAKGAAFEEICRLTRESGIDLIVISTRGHTGLKHLALGSTAERVVRYSTCPVLVMHPTHRAKKKDDGAGAASLRFRKLLVPIDFSECSMHGLNYAKALAKKFDAKLVLLHAVALQYYVASDEYARYDLPVLMLQAERAAREQLRDLVKETDWDGVDVEKTLQLGHAGEQVCARAEELGTDAIVTSTHGTTGFKHVLLGSTAEYIVRHAKCPVFVVPSCKPTTR
ncbi:MAG: universal stress protein [Chthoniobacterales bacterium]